MKRPYCLLLALVIPLFSPLVSFASEAPTPYRCDNGSRVDISLSTDANGRPQATLHFADATLTLPQVPAAAGALYRQGDIRLHTEDDEALFEDGKGNHRRCHRGLEPIPSNQTSPSATRSNFIDIHGSVSYRSRLSLPHNAVLSIRIEDATPGHPTQTLVEQRYELNGAQVPIPFSATIDRDLIGKKTHLTASARIEAKGKLRYVSDHHYPVLRHGQPITVDLNLKAVGNRRRH